jgi:hypothetical protein
VKHVFFLIDQNITVAFFPSYFSFIHLFNKYLVSTYYVSGTVGAIEGADYFSTLLALSCCTEVHRISAHAPSRDLFTFISLEFQISQLKYQVNDICFGCLLQGTNETMPVK